MLRILSVVITIILVAAALLVLWLFALVVMSPPTGEDVHPRTGLLGSSQHGELTAPR